MRTCFTLVALLLVGCLVGAAVLGVIERHLKEHRHNGPAPKFGIEPVHGAEAQARREVEQGGRHGGMVANGTSEKHVRGGRP
jgi:hypothetical protein